MGYGDERNIGQHAEILSCPVSKHCLATPKEGARLLGWSTGMAYVCRKCLCNAHNAFCNRHATKQPPVSRDLMLDAYPDFVKAMKIAYPDYAFHPMIIFSNWLEKWALGKQQSIVISRRYDELLPAKAKAMVKWEVYSKLPTKARLIQFYRNLATQAEFAPEFTAAQKAICAVFLDFHVGHGIDVTFASGMKASEIADWMNRCVSRGARWFYERDGKTWDATMGPMHARFKEKLYETLDQRLADFARSCDRIKAFLKTPAGLFRYKVAYTVKSGHNDTTLGNSIINAAIAYCALKRAGVRASIIVAGDDLLVCAYDEVSCEQLVALERDYGIIPEARVFTSFERTSFISGIFLSDDERIYFTPTPGRLLRRLWWSVNPPSKKNLAAYQRGVVLGLLPTCRDIPIIRFWLRRYEGSGRIGRSDKGYVFRTSEYDIGALWRAFEVRYNLSRYELEDCENWLMRLSADPQILVHPVLDRIIAIDEADISERGRGLWPD